MYSQRKRRRIKPLARPTSYDLNVSFDIRHYQNVKYGNLVNPYFPAIATNEAFQIMEGELLMKFKPDEGASYRDHQMHVFSFANGLKTDGDAITRRLNANTSAPDVPIHTRPTRENPLVAFDERRSILNKMEFAGVAVTGFKPEVDVFEQGFVATVGGLNTIFNNGKDTIHAGQILVVDIPQVAGRDQRKNRALQGGIPNDKLQFVVRPFDNALTDYGGNEKFVARYIIGTALSYARAGDPVDIVLHRCNQFGWNCNAGQIIGQSQAEQAAATADAVTRALDEQRTLVDDNIGAGRGAWEPAPNPLSKKTRSRKKKAPTMTNTDV